MYHFDNNNNNKDEPSPSPNEHSNYNHSSSYNPMSSQSFHPSSFHHQSHSLDDSFSFLNFDNNAAPPSFLQDCAVDSLGHDSLLAQDWNALHTSTIPDNTQQNNQLFLPLQQQQQQIQIQQYNTQQKQPHPPSDSSDLFLSLTEQEQQAILMTEPNFLRQQHLLHDNKMKMEMEDLDIHGTKDSTGTPPMRSNLSAMFDQPTTTNNHSIAPISLSSSSIPPSSQNALSATSPNDVFQSTYHPPPMSHSMGFENRQHHQLQQPYSTSASTTTVKRMSSSNTKPRKEINRRCQQGIGARGNNRANPIPINAGSSSTSGAVTKHSSSVPTEIDHQRRFNELQARFRINYARKSNTSGNTTASSASSSQQQQQQPSSFSGGSNGFGNRTSRDFMTANNGASVFGSSMPTSMEKRLMESVYGDGNDAENETTQSNNNMESTANVAVPKKNSSTNSNNLRTSTTTNSMKSASSFPSRTMPIQIQRVQRANTNQPVDADQLQKRLDDQLIKANFDDITVSELKEMLRQRGKPATGKKAILLQRLVDERDNINAVRSGKVSHRHSQPPLSSSSSMDPTYSSPLLESPSSVPNSSMFLSSSPGSSTLSLNRSIANMHIGSPPIPSSSQQYTRRFSPYNNNNSNNTPTGSSPRLGSSPKTPLQNQAYSSSTPSNYNSSSPNNNNNEMMIPSSSFNGGLSPMSPSMNSARNKRPYQGWNGRQKSYAPFTSSALATPDHDNDKDPFDMMTKDTMDMNIQQYNHHEIKDESMEWMNQSSVGNLSLNGILQDLPEGVSIDQFMVWLNENDQFNMNMDTTGMVPMDINRANYTDGPIYDELAPGGPDYTN